MAVSKSLILVALLLVVVSCGNPEQTTDEATTTPSTEAVDPSDTVDSVSPTTSPSSEDSPTTEAGTDMDTSLGPFVDMAVADLSEKLDIAESSVEVLSATLVTWSDASLGCPEPGMQYAQVLTDGALIELMANDQTYSYHMGGNEFEPFLCEEPKAPAEGDSGSKETETRSTPYGDLVIPVTEETVPPPGYDD